MDAADIWAAVLPAVISALASTALVIVARLVDRFIPDPDGKHPLPETPTLPDGKP